MSGMIGKVAWDIGFDAVQELSDKATDEEFNASVRENALASGIDSGQMTARVLCFFTV